VVQGGEDAQAEIPRISEVKLHFFGSRRNAIGIPSRSDVIQFALSISSANYRAWELRCACFNEGRQSVGAAGGEREWRSETGRAAAPILGPSSLKPSKSSGAAPDVVSSARVNQRVSQGPVNCSPAFAVLI
jgi:hypothetical protein